jgi:hypothetical protein
MKSIFFVLSVIVLLFAAVNAQQKIPGLAGRFHGVQGQQGAATGPQRVVFFLRSLRTDAFRL